MIKSMINLIFSLIIISCLAKTQDLPDILGMPKAPPLPNGSRCTATVKAVQKSLPSVVNISTERLVKISDPFANYFKDFFDNGNNTFKKSIPLGSGVLIDKAGLIVTNYHVIKRASNIVIRLWGGKKYNAVSVAEDPINDLALLQISDLDPKDELTPIAFGAPSDLFLGESVITIGNPFGLDHSVATGVLSAKNRVIREQGIVFNDIIQTDAAINPGNSGGPLLNLDGELIGLNLAIRRNSEGIGFAIPLSRIETVLAKWLVPSRFSLATCGFTPKTIIQNGKIRVIASKISPESPAAAAGLRAGDQILQVNNQPVSRAIDIGHILWKLQPRSKVTIKISGNEEKVITLGEMDASQLANIRLGIKLKPLTANLKKAKGFPEQIDGMIITKVDSDSEFAQRKVRRGDIIEQIGSTKTKSNADLLEALKDIRPGSTVPIFFKTVENIRGKLFIRRFGINVTLK